jgi:hypothetical protein
MKIEKKIHERENVHPCPGGDRRQRASIDLKKL